MADVAAMTEIEATASRLGVDLSTIDLDSIRLPPGDNFGIIRCVFHMLFVTARIELVMVTACLHLVCVVPSA